MGEFRSEGRGESGERSSGGYGRPRRDFGGRSGGRSGGFGGGRGGGGFGGGRGGGRSGGGRPLEMHDAICAKCKRECQVPFRPSGTKPVLCRDCFSQTDAGASRGPSRERSFAPRSDNAQSSSGSSMGSSDQMAQINAKLDRIIKVLQDLEIDSDEEEETPVRGSDEEVEEEADETGEVEDEPKDK